MKLSRICKHHKQWIFNLVVPITIIGLIAWNYFLFVVHKAENQKSDVYRHSVLDLDEQDSEDGSRRNMMHSGQDDELEKLVSKNKNSRKTYTIMLFTRPSYFQDIVADTRAPRKQRDKINSDKEVELEKLAGKTYAKTNKIMSSVRSHYLQDVVVDKRTSSKQNDSINPVQDYKLKKLAGKNYGKTYTTVLYTRPYHFEDDKRTPRKRFKTRQGNPITARRRNKTFSPFDGKRLPTPIISRTLRKIMTIQKSLNTVKASLLPKARNQPHNSVKQDMLSTINAKTFSGDSFKDKKKSSRRNASPNESGKPSVKTILLYTTIFGNTKWPDLEEETEPTFTKRCKFSNCRITYNKSALKFADVVVFHAVDLLGEPDLFSADILRNVSVTVRPEHQRWIFFIQESPVYYSNFKSYDGMFN